MKPIGSRELRVAFLVDSLRIGGSELAAFRTARSLKLGSALTVLHLQADGPLLERYRSIGATVRHMPIYGFRDPRFLLAIARLASLLSRAQIDVVHSHDYYSNVIAAVAVMASRRTRHVAARRWLDQYVRPMHERMDAWAQRSAKCVLVNSSAVAERCKAVGVSERRIVQLNNFIEDREFVPPNFPARENVRVGMVGRLAQVKNYPLAIRAFAKVREQCPRIELHIAGEGECEMELRGLVESLGIVSHVHFLGRVAEGPEIHRSFDILLLTSTSEGSPNAVLEAMVAGRAVVATRVGGVPELVQHERSGLIFDSNDEESIAGGLLDLAKDAERRRQFGQSGYSIASSNNRESVYVRRLLELYRTI